MNENLNVELNSRQRELLLEGLRYVRSARRFEFRDLPASPDERRDSDLRAIAALMSRLDVAAAVPARAEA